MKFSNDRVSKISWIPISDLSVGVLQGVEVSLAGLGPLNWVGRKVNYVTVMLGLLEINLNLYWVGRKVKHWVSSSQPQA